MFFLPDRVPEGAQGAPQRAVFAVAVGNQPGAVQAKAAAAVQQVLVHHHPCHLGQKQLVAAQRDSLGHPALEGQGALGQDGAVRVDRARLGVQAQGREFVHVPPALDPAPVHRPDQRLGGQVDGEQAARFDQAVAVPLGPQADGHHGRPGADGARPAHRNEVGLFHAAAGHQHRRHRVQKGRALPALFRHPWYFLS